MSIFDKAKALSSKAVEKVAEFSGDELIADTIIKALEKQERVNVFLQKKGSNYRVSDLNLEMGVPPKLVFGIRRVTTDKTMNDEQNTMLIKEEDHVR